MFTGPSIPSFTNTPVPDAEAKLTSTMYGVSLGAVAPLSFTKSYVTMLHPLS